MKKVFCVLLIMSLLLTNTGLFSFPTASAEGRTVSVSGGETITMEVGELITLSVPDIGSDWTAYFVSLKTDPEGHSSRYSVSYWPYFASYSWGCLEHVMSDPVEGVPYGNGGNVFKAVSAGTIVLIYAPGTHDQVGWGEFAFTIIVEGDDPEPSPPDGELTADLTFDQSSVDYIAGSLGKYSGGGFSETTLTPTLTVTNESSTETASNIKMTLTAPDGFSFDPIDYQRTYDKISVFSLAPGSSKSNFTLPKVYPIYDEKYKYTDMATFTAAFTSSLNDGSGTKDISVNRHTNIDGKIKYHQTKEVGLDWSLNNFTYSDSFLCKLSAGLSISVYNAGNIKETFYDLGFTNVFVGSSGTGEGDDLAFAIKKVIQGGKIETIVAVALRGTQGSMIYGSEWWGNYKAIPKRSPLMEDSRGYHSGFADMFDGVVTQLSKYRADYVKTASASTRILVTGHSRAAAVANILGAHLDEMQAWAPQSNIYVYTFATPNVKRDITNSSKYNNIHNIINNADPVPDVPFEWWGYQKFGQSRYFSQPELKSYHFYYKAKKLIAGSLSHDMTTYLNWAFSGQSTTSKIATDFTETVIACPVDVEVYDRSGTLVGKIVDNRITFDPDDSGIVLSVVGDEKLVDTPTDAAYSIRLKATNAGKMDVSVTSVEGKSMKAASVKRFADVNLSNGKQFEITIGGAVSAASPRLLVVDNGKTLEEIPGFLSKLPFLKTQTYAQGKFGDVKSTDWFAPNVATAYEFGLMKGTSDTKFSPGSKFTLAEAITLAARIHSIYNTGSENFVQTSTWYQVYVDYAMKNKIITHSYDKYTAPITREEFADILSRALPVGELTALHPDVNIPDDNSISSSYLPQVLLLYKAGVLMGYAGGSFRPRNNITRAEASAIVTRMVDPSLRL